MSSRDSSLYEVGASRAASGADDDDPIVASYSVFIKPPLPENRKLIILQYVNRISQDPTSIAPPRIKEIRVKPITGQFEVDVPVETSQAYDQGKGIKWGTDLKKSMEAKQGGSLGLAGGFGIGSTTARAGAAGRRGNDDSDYPMEWNEALRQEKVLKTQTLGGARSAEEKTANFMVGVFQGKNIHLTPVSSLVHLRPVPHHIDASAEQEKLARPAASGGANAGDGKAGAGRAIHMTLKSAMDDGATVTETMADRLRAVQKEPWRRMEWVPDDDVGAWEAYNDCLLMRSSSGKEAEVGGKGKGVEKDDVLDDSGAPDLVDRVSKLETNWGEEELLRAVAGIKAGDPKPGEEAVTQAGSAKATNVKGKGKEPASAEVKVEKTKKKPGRPTKTAAGSAATATRRGGRGRGSGPSDAMQID